MSERVDLSHVFTNKEDPQYIRVEPNVAFRINPELVDDYSHEAPKIFRSPGVELKIEGLGSGSIEVVSDIAILFEFDPPVDTPAGRVIMKKSILDGESSIDHSSLPVTFEVHLEDILPEQTDRVSCELIYDDTLVYEGEPTIDPEDQDLDIDKRVPVHFRSWLREGQIDPLYPYFPVNPDNRKQFQETLRKLQFMIIYEPGEE